MASNGARVRLSLILALGFALAACASAAPHLAPPAAPARPHGPQLWVTIAANANQNSPVAVDLALVTNSKLLKLLQQVPVADWFQHRTEWELDNPKTLTVRSWQWIPGQQIPPVPLPLPGGVKAALIFANYDTPGAKPLLVDPGHGVVLDLLTDGVAAHAAP